MMGAIIDACKRLTSRQGFETEVRSGSEAHEDLQDIQASLAGDGAAYERLVTRYEKIIAAQLWRFTRDRRQLEEMTQDVFVEAYRSLGGFRGGAPFLHWLRRIATRVGYRHWRHESREREQRSLLVERGQEVTPTRQEPSSPSEAGEYLFLLLEQLPPQDRLVLTLLYFEDCDTHEIAERMGWTRSLVKVRAYRARKKLRGMLEAEGYGSVHDG